jgi:purine-binding chemotaxis protein CheW
MDMAKIRKKLKRLKTSSEQKESPEDAQKTVDIKPEASLTTEPPVKGEPTTVEIKTDKTPVKEIEIIAFKIANEEYAVRISKMQEILRYQRITPVPRSPRYLKGVTFLRGKVLPVIDLKDRLGLKGEVEGKQKIIVLATSKEPVGALVSSVLDVIRFPETELLQPPATLDEREKSFIEGVVRIQDRFISILNVEEIVNMEVP